MKMLFKLSVHWNFKKILKMWNEEEAEILDKRNKKNF